MGLKTILFKNFNSFLASIILHKSLLAYSTSSTYAQFCKNEARESSFLKISASSSRHGVAKKLELLCLFGTVSSLITAHINYVYCCTLAICICIVVVISIFVYFCIDFPCLPYTSMS